MITFRFAFWSTNKETRHLYKISKCLRRFWYTNINGERSFSFYILGITGYIQVRITKDELIYSNSTSSPRSRNWPK